VSLGKLCRVYSLASRRPRHQYPPGEDGPEQEADDGEECDPNQNVGCGFHSILYFTVANQPAQTLKSTPLKRGISLRAQGAEDMERIRVRVAGVDYKVAIFEGRPHRILVDHRQQKIFVDRHVTFTQVIDALNQPAISAGWGALDRSR
jgi:hypothetical protein